MPFGLCNAPTAFLKMVIKIFNEYLNKFMQVFLDDLNVHGSKKEHLGQIQKCLEECRQNGISFNPKKCAFGSNLNVLLGHIFCSDGLLVDPKKIIVIVTMLLLVNVTYVT
jgi:hypothetical protein